MLMMNNKQKKRGAKRLLISVTVLGSAGPLRFVVGEDDPVAAVIDTALKSYAREGRLPLLTSELDDFFLYSPNAGHEALSPIEAIGSFGTRNFMLCKKPTASPAKVPSKVPAREDSNKKAGNTWKLWLNKSLNMKIIPTH